MFVRIVIILFLGAAFLAPFPAVAQHHGGPGWYKGMPYGRSCPGRRSGPYGARAAIKTPEEAKQAIEKYYAESGRKVQVTIIDERRRFYVADIAEPEGALIDTLIIDKRSGRIRSIY